MELRLYDEADLWLAEALESDPEVMEHLGGPVPREEIARVHHRRAASAANGVGYFTIWLDETSGPVGTVGVWETEWERSNIHETGWMILPTYQGRGLASEAVKQILARARADQDVTQIHAFPSVLNAASNAICRKFGFSHLGECSVSYQGRGLRSNHWCLDVGS